MQTILNYLKKLDFSEFESKLYLILLKTGSMTVAELAQKADINRTAAYGYINALLKKGVISETKGTHNKITANPPAQLYYLVDQKISAASLLKEDLSDIVPFLNRSYMQSTTDNGSEIKYFKGRNNVKAIYTDLLKANKIRAYFNPEDLGKHFLRILHYLMKLLNVTPHLLSMRLLKIPNMPEPTMFMIAKRKDTIGNFYLKILSLLQMISLCMMVRLQ